MTFERVKRSIFLVLLISCSADNEPENIVTYPLPSQLDASVTARLTERHETENIIFYFQPGDIIEFDRCEAYAQWAINYLDISLPKKIEYFKFKSRNEMEEATGINIGGYAFVQSTALATYWKWHNHEIFHVISYLWSNEHAQPLFFMEGIAVAHELDPYNNDWEPRYTRYHDDPNQESYLTSVKRFKQQGKLYPILDMLESDAWQETHSTQTEDNWIDYPQAGIFIYYLIDQYGSDKVTKLYDALDIWDDLETIKTKFEIAIGVSVEQAEQEWLLWLDG